MECPREPGPGAARFEGGAGDACPHFHPSGGRCGRAETLFSFRAGLRVDAILSVRYHKDISIKEGRESVFPLGRQRGKDLCAGRPPDETQEVT